MDSQGVDGTPESLLERLVQQLRHGDEDGVLERLREALASGLTGQEVYLELLQPALEQTGHDWESGQTSVAEEHRATATVRWLMSALWDYFTPESYREGNRPLLAGCAEGERHDVGIQMVCDFLRQDGWHVVNLGADVPEIGYVEMATTLNPLFCLLSASTPETASVLRNTVHRLSGA